MSNWRSWLIVILSLSAAFVLFYLLGVEADRNRQKECRVLAAIGVKAGDNITIYGDMPTWKIACLMGDGDN